MSAHHIITPVLLDKIRGYVDAVLANDTIDLHDIPILVNVVHDALMTVVLPSLSSHDMCLLIRLLVCELLDMNGDENTAIGKMIDVSIVLLQKKVRGGKKSCVVCSS